MIAVREAPEGPGELVTLTPAYTCISGGYVVVVRKAPEGPGEVGCEGLVVRVVALALHVLQSDAHHAGRQAPSAHAQRYRHFSHSLFL